MSAEGKRDLMYLLLLGYLADSEFQRKAYSTEYLAQEAHVAASLIVDGKRPNGEHSDLCCDAWLYGSNVQFTIGGGE